MFCEDKVPKDNEASRLQSSSGWVKKARCHTADNAVKNKRICAPAGGWKISTVTVINWNEGEEHVRDIEGNVTEELPRWAQMGGLQSVNNRCELDHIMGWVVEKPPQASAERYAYNPYTYNPDGAPARSPGAGGDPSNYADLVGMTGDEWKKLERLRKRRGLTAPSVQLQDVLPIHKPK